MENREKTNGGEAEIDLINQLYIGNKIEKKKIPHCRIGTVSKSNIFIPRIW